MADAEAVSAIVHEINHLLEELPEEKKNGNIGKMISYVLKNVLSFHEVQTKLQMEIHEVAAVRKHREKVERMLNEAWAEAENCVQLEEQAADPQTNETTLSWVKQWIIRALGWGESKNCEQAADSQANGTINRVKQEIIRVLNHVAENGPETMKKHLYDHFDSSPEEFYEHVEQTSTIKEHEETMKLISDGMRSYHETESDKMIINMTKKFAATAVGQFLKLYISWKEISSASNVIGDSCEITMINKNLESMENMVTQLLRLCESNPNYIRLNLTMSNINTRYTATLHMISNLKVNIDGRIQRLDLLADTSVVDGVASAANAASQVYHLSHEWSNLTTFPKVLGVVSVALFTVFAVANFKTHQLSRSALEDLRVKLKEVAHLQIQLQDLLDKATLAVEAVEEVQYQRMSTQTRETGSARVERE